VAMKHGSVAEIVQVCYELTPDNLKRELNGVLKAMKFFKQQKAVIVTLANSDLIEEDGCKVDVIPAYKYLVDN
jgi:predicted AAA+ superfamily ATPase